MREEAMTARESFESWAKKEWNYKPHFIVSRYDKGSHKGEYVDPAIEHAWRAWCFVAAAKDAEIARLRQRVEELELPLRMAYEWEKDCPRFEAVCPKCQWKKKAEAALRGEGGK